MRLSKEEDKQYVIVDSYVRQKAKVWFMQSKQKWSAAITILIDIHHYGSSYEDCLTKLVNRIWNYQEARNHILSQHDKPLALYVKEDMICPIRKIHCNDECCTVGSTCNMSMIYDPTVSMEPANPQPPAGA